MRKNITILFITIICIGILSCNKTKNKESSDKKEELAVDKEKADRKIDNISALFYNYIFVGENTVKPEDIKKDIPDFEIDKRGVLDAVITDTFKIKKIDSLLNSLKVSDSSNPVDVRIVALINYNDGSKDSLCIGGEYSNIIYWNGVEQSGSNELLFLLKNYIGFYPWMIGDDMLRMTEIRDNSFPKEPFVSTPYYKEYQKALAAR